MSEVSIGEIIAWVEADDLRPEVAALSPVVQDAAIKAESEDRALLVDTAVRARLFDELDTLNKGIRGLVESRNQVQKALGIKVNAKTEEAVPDSDQPIQPFCLITAGLKRYSYGGPKDDEGYRRYTAFRSSVKGVTGDTVNGQTLSKLIELLLIRKPLMSTRYQPWRDITRGVMEFSEQGVTFLSEDPSEYRRVMREIKGVGPDTTKALVRFLQNMTTSTD